jgi:hypothetical protein
MMKAGRLWNGNGMGCRVGEVGTVYYYVVLVEGVNHGTYLPHSHARTADAPENSVLAQSDVVEKIQPYSYYNRSYGWGTELVNIHVF